MQVQDVVSRLGLKVLAMRREAGIRPVQSGFVGDVLSQVMGAAQPGSVWITAQTHENVVAVATVVDAACVLVCQREVPAETVKRAGSEGITLLWSDRTAFEVSGRLYGLLSS